MLISFLKSLLSIFCPPKISMSFLLLFINFSHVINHKVTKTNEFVTEYDSIVGYNVNQVGHISLKIN